MSQGTISHAVRRESGIVESAACAGVVSLDEVGRGVCRMQRSADAGQTQLNSFRCPLALLAAVPQGYRVRLQQPICLFSLAFRKIKISLERICRVAACTLMQGPRQQNNRQASCQNLPTGSHQYKFLSVGECQAIINWTGFVNEPHTTNDNPNPRNIGTPCSDMSIPAKSVE